MEARGLRAEASLIIIIIILMWAVVTSAHGDHGAVCGAHTGWQRSYADRQHKMLNGEIPGMCGVELRRRTASLSLRLVIQCRKVHHRGTRYGWPGGRHSRLRFWASLGSPYRAYIPDT
jgi:hypothetical protein